MAIAAPSCSPDVEFVRTEPEPSATATPTSTAVEVVTAGNGEQAGADQTDGVAVTDGTADAAQGIPRPTVTPGVPIPTVTPRPPDRPIPTPTPLPPWPCTGPASDQHQRIEVINVDPDDPDGGLVVHVAPGASTPQVGVLPWDASRIEFVFDGCEIIADGGEWWNIRTDDFEGWANAFYLGDRVETVDLLSETACSRGSRPFGVVASAPPVSGLALVDFDYQSSPECDRVVITLGQGYDGFGAMTTSVPLFPGGQVAEESQFEVRNFEIAFTPDVASAFDSVWFNEQWLDAATGEQNVVVAYDRDGRPNVHVGWGTGTAAVRYLDAPARIVIDIFQEPSAPGTIAGPLVGPAVLFDPIQTDLDGAGVTLPISVRGYSRGFEASTSLHLSTWDQQPRSHPFEWNAELFTGAAEPVALGGGGGEGGGVEAVFAAGDPFLGLDRTPFPFTTPGYFEFKITDLEPGAYQLAVEPSSGCAGPYATGQQFRVIDEAGSDADQADDTEATEATEATEEDAEAIALAEPFSVSFDIRQAERATFVTSVRGEEQRTPLPEVPC